MTSEAIKALMILAPCGVLEITLFYSSTRKLAKRPVSSHVRQAATGEFASRTPED
ncbi:hypothetical protein JQ596_16655 [Bradyrhizobium manausense]|uniref:hypothetical protein n=1 Tax=Bradyrhizobium manausense TaxID=989370 RepID=UPI001BA59EA8|nr:hypothetical protein [Bradyrhizobium manausense]MBR0827168.1 hypothetical protein [Bradyrhizobium manausense]